MSPWSPEALVDHLLTREKIEPHLKFQVHVVSTFNLVRDTLSRRSSPRISLPCVTFESFAVTTICHEPPESQDGARRLKFFWEFSSSACLRLSEEKGRGGKMTSEIACGSSFSRYSHDCHSQVPKYGRSTGKSGTVNTAFKRIAYKRNPSIRE